MPPPPPAANSAPVRWGILGAAAIADERVVPAMAASPLCEVVAVAARDAARARAFADRHAIPRAFARWEALLADPEVEAIYNPLPNHLHREWTIRAAEAGKHVLCEKPLALTTGEIDAMIAARARTGVEIEEALMCRDHPQWTAALALLAAGRIGDLRGQQASFCYMNRNPGDIRNRPETGGGGLRDIGSYAIAMTRLAFAAEPVAVMAHLERDPDFTTDRQAAMILAFPGGRLATLYAATQVQRYERLHLFGEAGWLALEAPYVQPPEHVCRLLVGQGAYPSVAPTEVIEIPPANHYRAMAERFSRRVRGARGAGAEARPLEWSRGTVAVTEALIASAESGRWETPAGACTAVG